MLRLITLIILTITLTGCIQTNTLLQRDVTAQQYYKLDSRDLRLCRGETSNCFALAPIASARTLLKPTEEKYGQAISGPNYPVNFARMLINPPNQAYTAEVVGDGRFYHLPVNDYTNTAWSTLETVYKAYYDN